MLSVRFLMDHLFEEGQTEPTNDRWISGFFVEAKVSQVGVRRAFPLMEWTSEANDGEDHERASD